MIQWERHWVGRSSENRHNERPTATVRMLAPPVPHSLTASLTRPTQPSDSP